MADFPYADFDALFDDVQHAYWNDEFQQAHDLVVTGIDHLPRANVRFLRFVRSMLLARLGETDAALDVLHDLIEGGYWATERYWLDEDFDSIRDNAEFQRLHALSTTRLQNAQRAARPELFTFMPAGEPDDLPLLLALHGNHSSVMWHQAHWSPAAEAGWLVAMPQSSQLVGQDSGGNHAFSWDDEDVIDREISAHLTGLRAAYQLDPDQVVIGGFSRGAETAIRLALTGAVDARGFIAVCPGGPYTADPPLWEPVIEAGRDRAISGHVIIGGQDHYVEGAETLIDMLRAMGIYCGRELQVDMGHTYPPKFSPRLPDLLATVLT